MNHPAGHEPALRSEIKAAMTAAGVTCPELARRTGLPIGHLRRHLDGEGGFSVSVLLAVAPALDTDPYRLLERAGAVQ